MIKKKKKKGCFRDETNKKATIEKGYFCHECVTCSSGQRVAGADVKSERMCGRRLNSEGGSKRSSKGGKNLQPCNAA